jgi:hypothetical protein
MTDAQTIPSSFGGGWIIPLTPAGSMTLADFFDEEPAPIPVPIGEGGFPFGYIIEPYQMGDLAEHMKSAGITWERR